MATRRKRKDDEKWERLWEELGYAEQERAYYAEPWEPQALMRTQSAILDEFARTGVSHARRVPQAGESLNWHISKRPRRF